MQISPRSSTWQRLKKSQGVSKIFKIDITPCPKPRMTRRDKWAKRPIVVKYFDYCNRLRLIAPEIQWEGISITFVLPMPKSWSKKKMSEMDGKPHTQKPDLDNLLKAFADALLKDDSGLWYFRELKKVWGEKGEINVN